jgi:hypothetical protein
LPEQKIIQKMKLNEVFFINRKDDIEKRLKKEDIFLQGSKFAKILTGHSHFVRQRKI